MKTVIANTIWSVERRREHKSEKEMIERCGFNTGNVCFCDTMLSQLKYADRISCFDVAHYEKREKDMVFVYPAANWINTSQNILQEYFSPLEKEDIKLCVLGLGVQMPSEISTKEFVKNLSEENIRALKIMSEHSMYIGVRGGDSGEVLDKLGIHNWRIIGCPSFYELYRQYGLPEIKTQKKIKAAAGISGNSKISDIIMRLAKKNKSVLIMQDIEDIEKASGAEYENRKIFYTRESWSCYLRREEITFCFGPRFHGNLMALSNGIPALWIDHDRRTGELIETMKLPHMSMEELLCADSVESLMDNCVYGKEFQENYMVLLNRYVELLNECEVEHFIFAGNQESSHACRSV